jgi:hypothetical protein
MLSLVLDPLSEYGCDFFGFLVFICTYPRGTFFFRRIPHFLSGSTVGLLLDIGSPTDLFWNLGTGWLYGVPAVASLRRYNISSDVLHQKTPKEGRRPRAASRFRLFNLGGHSAAAGGLPKILPFVMNEID